MVWRPGQQPALQPVPKDDIISYVYFLLRRLTIDNRSPSHPASYDQTVLESKLFSPEFFGKIMDLPTLKQHKDHQIDRFNNSKLKIAFIQQLATFCYNDPTQITQALEKGLLDKVVETLQNNFPVMNSTGYLLFEFLRTVVVHEKGSEFVKTNKLFEKFLRPFDYTGSADDAIKAMIIQSTNNEKYKKPTCSALVELVRNNDPYFLETAQSAVVDILKHVSECAAKLQTSYYRLLTECRTNKVPKRHFQIQVVEQMMELPEYHIVKFEVDKLASLCATPGYDGAPLQQQALKILAGSAIEQLFDVFERLSSIKPVFDFTQRGTPGERPHERQTNACLQLAQMFTLLIHEGRNGQHLRVVEAFEKRVRRSQENLAQVFCVPDGPENLDVIIKKANLLELMGSDREVPAKCKENEILSCISEVASFRGFLIANVLIVGQYIAVFEDARKSTQQHLCVHHDWSRELRILSCFMTAFNECNHKITDQFFNETESFIQQGIVTQKQIEIISKLYTHKMTTEEKEDFAANRKQIEENIDLYRENLTYLDQDYIKINRLLQVALEYWRKPQHSNGRSVEEVLLKNKKSYTAMTIRNILDTNETIDRFDQLKNSFNSTEFLTTISRLYTYISELQQLIQGEQLSGITFYEFVEQGCLRQLIRIYTILRTFSLQRLSIEKDEHKQIRFISVDCIQSINRQIKNVLSHFINCSQVLT